MHLPRGTVLLFVLLGLKTTPAQSDDLACLSTTFRFLGANDKVCVSAFDDPKVPGVACHISQARTGGVKGSLGLAEDPSRFSIACRQVGPVTVDITKLPEEESAYSERTSIFFKHTQVFRMVDKKHNTLIYIAISDKIVAGRHRIRFRPFLLCHGGAEGSPQRQFRPFVGTHSSGHRLGITRA